AICFFIDIRVGLIFLIGAIFVLGNVTLKVLRSAAISSRVWKRYSLIAIISQLILLITAVIFAFYGVDDIMWWVTAYALSGLAPVFYALIAAKRQGVKDYKTTSEFATVRREGFRLLPASLGSMSMQRADRLLLPFLASPAALGIYVVAATAVAISVWPVQQWSDSKLNTWASNRVTSRWALLRTLGMAASITLFLGLCLASVVWLAVDFMLGPAYQATKDLLPPLIVGHVLYALARVLQGHMIAAGQSRYVTVSELAGMFISVGFCFVLIPTYEAAGAAYSILLGNLGSVLLGGIMWNRTRSETLKSEELDFQTTE